MSRFDRLKTTIASSPSAARDYYDLKKGPSTKYTPSRPGDGRPVHTRHELEQSSSALHNFRQQGLPPPPPRRNVVTGPAKPVENGALHDADASIVKNFENSSNPGDTLSSFHRAPMKSVARLPANDDFTPKPFSKYTAQDKQEFFMVLDEYFNSRPSVSIPSDAQSSKPVPSQSAPPVVSLATRPSHSPSRSATRPPTKTPASDVPSYPPQEPYRCAALAFVNYIMFMPYETPWFADPSPAPPILQGRTDIQWGCAFMQQGDAKSLVGICVFGDTSVAWYKINWSARAQQSGTLDPTGVGLVKEGKYRPIVTPWDGERLYAASELYGSSIVDFANRAVAGGQPIARGECWDMANEALKELPLIGLPKPFPSIGRTHGQLIFYSRANKQGKWTGGDGYVRGGDIVEWRTVKIRQQGMSKYSSCTLGDPDHTAVIISAAQTTPGEDGQEYAIASLGELTVVEQSVGSLPSECTYDMSTMEDGEIWIYRPVPLLEFLETEIQATWPPPGATYDASR